MPDEHGGFEGVRENVDGHPMWSLLVYARSCWPPLGERARLGLYARRPARPPVVVHD
jgi:ATP-binding cassette subfamily B protein